MDKYVTLIGYEQVQNAARTMSSAADQMQRAASNTEYSLQQHQRFLDDWLQRFTDVLERYHSKDSSNA